MIYKFSTNDKKRVTLFSDIGTEELFMSRIFHFEDEILPGIFGNEARKEMEEAITQVLFAGLIPAFGSLRDLRKKWVDAEIPEITKRQILENIYIYLTIAYKNRFQEVARLMGYDIGFLFQKDKTFETGCARFSALHPRIDPEFIEVIKDDRKGWSKLMVDVRNDLIEHAGGKDRSKIKFLESYMDLDSAETIFEHCWRRMEDFLFVLAVDKIDPNFGHTIGELKEYKQDENHRERFRWFHVQKQ